MKNITFTKDKISLDIRFSLEDNTIWMTQNEIAQLFSVTRVNITNHIKILEPLFNENKAICKSDLLVAQDGKIRKMSLYNLDAIRQIGFKINPLLTQEFYDWCLKQLQTLNSKNIPIQSNLIRFDNGIVQLDVTINPVEYTVYLTKEELLVLFDTSRQNLEHHISNIYDSCELEERATCKKYLQVQLEGNREVNREIVSYNLDMIISLGYRINTKRGIEFRRWATSILKQYLLKGYVVDEKRTLVTNENYLNLVNKVMSIDERVKTIEEERNIVMPKDQLFIDNSLYDSKTYLAKLIMSANKSITVVDPYADIMLLSVISHKNKGCSITLITSKKNKIIDKELETFNQNYGGLKMYIDNSFHDRYLVLDDTIYYHMGASINYFGAKITQLTKIEDTKIIDFLKNRLEIYKSGSATNI